VHTHRSGSPTYIRDLRTQPQKILDGANKNLHLLIVELTNQTKQATFNGPNLRTGYSQLGFIEKLSDFDAKVRCDLLNSGARGLQLAGFDPAQGLRLNANRLRQFLLL
jgi:hypothetical protein